MFLCTVWRLYLYFYFIIYSVAITSDYKIKNEENRSEFKIQNAADRQRCTADDLDFSLICRCMYFVLVCVKNFV